MSQVDEIIKILYDKNYYEYLGDYLRFHVVNKNNSYYIEFHMKSFEHLKMFKWYKYFSYTFKYNCLTGHIHNSDLLKKIIDESVKLDKMYMIY